jgi:DNA-binding transcriptional ArsR family regulator
MPKVTLDMNTFKALASDSRLDILRSLDGKKLSLNDISKVTKLNKATLHEHLAKLNQAGLVKKYEREGHKWVYYKLTWKGEGLLHPENTRIVVMFSITFVSLLIGLMLLVSFAQPITVGMAETYGDTTHLYEAEPKGAIPLLTSNYKYNYIASVTAINQTVDDITLELQKNSHIRDYIGQDIEKSNIKWITPSNAEIKGEQFLLSKFNYSASSAKNDTNNESSYPYDIDENQTMGYYQDGEFIALSPEIPEMIATAQNINLLYLAIICITFFGVLFSFSTWRFLKSRKPII